MKRVSSDGCPADAVCRCLSRFNSVSSICRSGVFSLVDVKASIWTKIILYEYRIILNVLEIDHRLCKAPKPIPNFEAKSLLACLVLPWGTRWESQVLISSFFFAFLPPPRPPERRYGLPRRSLEFWSSECNVTTRKVCYREAMEGIQFLPSLIFAIYSLSFITLIGTTDFC